MAKTKRSTLTILDQARLAVREKDAPELRRLADITERQGFPFNAALFRQWARKADG